MSLIIHLVKLKHVGGILKVEQDISFGRVATVQYLPRRNIGTRDPRPPTAVLVRGANPKTSRFIDHSVYFFTQTTKTQRKIFRLSSRNDRGFCVDAGGFNYRLAGQKKSVVPAGGREGLLFYLAQSLAQSVFRVSQTLQFFGPQVHFHML